jgi:MtN3 and saliva related transmembrane protein
MQFQESIGITAGVLTSASMLPQLLKVIKEQNAKSLSLPMMCILITGLIFWVYYGILIHQLPIILSNGVAVIINGTLLATYFLYQKKK